jgi:hypothetical protein
MIVTATSPAIDLGAADAANPRYWLTSFHTDGLFHTDGFRFDLGVTVGREAHGFAVAVHGLPGPRARCTIRRAGRRTDGDAPTMSADPRSLCA